MLVLTRGVPLYSCWQLGLRNSLPEWYSRWLNKRTWNEEDCCGQASLPNIILYLVYFWRSKESFPYLNDSHQSLEDSALHMTVETAEVPRPPPVYYGCFLGHNLQLLNNTIIDGNTNALCQKYCYDIKHMFSATHGDTCGCLETIHKKELSGM